MIIDLDQLVVTILTITVVVANLAMAFRAFKTAISIDTHCRWMCVSNQKSAGLGILIGIGVIGVILSALKTWSIMDIFIHLWDHMPPQYHFRAFAYLTENFGVAIIGWKITTFIRMISGCQGPTPGD